MQKGAIDSKVQDSILKDLLENFLTVKQIANRRKTSVQAVYNCIKKLKKKGLIFGTCRGGLKSTTYGGRGGFNSTKKYRLHGQQFHIALLRKSEFRNRTIRYKGATINMYRDSIEVYAGSNEFTADTPQQAYDSSMLFWLTFFYRIEDKFKLFFIKDGWGFDIVAAHYEERQNELAREYKREGRQRMQIRASEDGKVWLEMDKSLNTDNLEEKHPLTALPDANKISAYFNSIRDNDVLNPHETTVIIRDILNVNKEYAINIKSHIKAIQDLNKGINEFRHEIRRFRHHKEDKQETIRKWF